MKALLFTPLVAALACLPACALAQAASARPSELPIPVERLAQMAMESADADLARLRREPGGERVVKGAPYCAEAVHENVQWLPDGQGGAGNRIVRKTSTRLCRDGEGRTRQEVDSGGRKLVYLADPVARENWVLDPEKKTARQLGGSGGFSWSGSSSGGIDSSAWRDYAERMREWARTMADSVRSTHPKDGIHAQGQPQPPARPTPPTPPNPPTPPTPPTPPMPALVEGPSGDREVRVYRFEGSGSVAPPEVRWRSQQFAPRGAAVLSPLGSKEIEGLRVNGERSTWTIEAGRYGNELPIVITRDIWTSPDLMLQVHSRDFDPRTGEVAYRLHNVKRGEPDAALMKVPGDYKATRRIERRSEERRDDRREERREKS